MIHIPPQRFPLGRLRITVAARALLDECNESAWTYLFRHGSGSWVAEEDREEFEKAVENDRPIISTHTTANGEKLVLRTASDRSQTIIMLPEEFQ